MLWNCTQYVRQNLNEFPAVALAHKCFVETEDFIETLYLTYPSLESEEEKITFMNLFFKMITLFSQKPLSFKWSSKLYYLATQEMKSASLSPSEELSGKCGSLMVKTLQLMRPPVSPHPNEKGVRLKNSIPLENIGQSVDETIKSKINEGKYSRTLLQGYAQDLRKYLADSFCKIPFEELIRRGLGKKDETPYIENYVKRFNALSYLVAKQILEPKKAEFRAHWYGFYVKIAKYLISEGDFNTSMAILGALNNNCISRLKETHEFLKPNIQKDEEKITKLFETSKNYKKYRSCLKKKMEENSPEDCCLIPFFGSILKDLTFIHDGNSHHLPNDQLNFDKLHMLADVFELFHQSQTLVKNFKMKPFHFNISELIDPYLKLFKDLSIESDECYDPLDRLSKKREPTNSI